MGDSFPAEIFQREDLHLILVVEHRAGSTTGEPGQSEALFITSGLSLEVGERMLSQALDAVRLKRSEEDA